MNNTEQKLSNIKSPSIVTYVTSYLVLFLMLFNTTIAAATGSATNAYNTSSSFIATAYDSSVPYYDTSVQFINANYSVVASNTSDIAADIYNPVAGALTGAATEVGESIANFANGFYIVTPRVITTSTSPYFRLDFSPCTKNKWEVTSPIPNTIFKPVIKAHMEKVTACLGYHGSVTLSAWGECKTMGFERACARFTAPCDHDNDHCCPGKECDNPAPSSCPGCKDQTAYRICVFDDPMLPWDLNDNNVHLMPFHERSPAPPTVTGGDDVTNTGALILAAGILVPGLGATVMAIGAATMLAGGIMTLAEIITSTINYTVTKTGGCIDIPMAPSPPPFFPTVVGSTPIASVTSICAYSLDYYINEATQAEYRNYGLPQSEITNLQYKQPSTISQPCEISGIIGTASVYSSYEYPAIRVSFNNSIPLCLSSTTTSTVDTCVLAQNMDIPANLESLNKSLIPICSTPSDINCIKFPSGRTTGGPFRAKYNLINNNENPASVVSTPFVWPTSGFSIELAGINDNEYVDLGVGTSATIYDLDNTARIIQAQYNANGDEICAQDITDSSGLPIEIGCSPRPALMQPPEVAALGGANADTQPKISVSVGTPAKIGVIGVDVAFPNPTSTESPPSFLAPTAFCVSDDIVAGGGTTSANPTPCYIYAGLFSAYITDNYNQTPASAPLGDGTVTPTATGQGIHYINGMYCSGATKICLSGYSDNNKKVIARTKKVTATVNGLTVDEYVVSDDVRDRIIPPYVLNEAYPLEDHALLFNPDTNYNTGTVTTPRIAIGFLNSGQYVENSTCTTDDISCVASSASYPTTTNCTCAMLSTPRSCEVQGCEAAFEVTDPDNDKLNYLGYKDNNGILYNFLDGSGKEQYGERPLNSIEQNLCANMTRTTCPGISDANSGVADGNASWPTVNAGDESTGTCIGDSSQNAAGPPTRTCAYIPDGTTKQSGCPNYTIAYSSVTNPCATNIPTWWPGEFLYAQSTYQGAILNQFNIIPEYMSKITPSAGNSTPLSYYNNPWGSGYLATTPEPWVSTTYTSCKTYGSNINKNLTPRTQTNGDQEMLFITRDNWRAIWSENDLSWLTEANGTNNGCYVYNISGKLHASVNASVTPGLKICKSQSKISYSLVDLAANSSTSYTNTAYIMQSNIVAYDQIATASASTVNDNFVPKVIVTNSVSSGYKQYINHGIVVNKSGFTSYSIPINDRPADFVAVSSAESIKSNYSLTGKYHYWTSKGNYYRSDTLSSNNNSCALSIYRQSVSYSSTPSTKSYFKLPNSTRTYNTPYTPALSSLYSYTQYDGGNRKGTWPNQSWCSMSAEFKNYTAGNSAANSSMFLWSSSTSYDVCNY